jgi:Tfp pilus assembly protein PilF
MARKHKPAKARLLRRKLTEAPPSELEAIKDTLSPADVLCEKARLSPKAFHMIVAAALATLCVLLYGWTLNFPMVFDDHLYLKNNPLVRDAASFGYAVDFQSFVSWPARHGMEPDLATNFILRPVAYATFYVNYVFDGFNPPGWRLVNIGVHAANAWLVYALLILLLSKAAGSKLPRSSAFFIGLTGSMLFAVHPMAIESVTYIVQRFTSLGAFFFLVTLVLHFAASAVGARHWRWSLRAGSVLALILGMQTKECAFTAPMIALLLDCVLLRAPWRSALRRALPLLLCLPIIPALVMLVAWAQNDGVWSWNAAVHITNSKDVPVGYWHYVFSQIPIVLEYLRLLVWPAGLNLDPDPPLHRSFFAVPVLLGLGVITALLAGTWVLRRRFQNDPRLAALQVFTLWFFATVVVSSGMVPLPNLMAEHRAYLPSIGIFAALACLMDLARTCRWCPKLARCAVPAGALAACAALSVATWQRNEVWSSSISLWEDTLAKSPNKCRIWNNLAVAYAEGNRTEKAVSCFEKAVALEPRYITAHMNLISTLNAMARYQDALNACLRLLNDVPLTRQSVDVQCQMGIALIGSGQIDKGKEFLKEVVSVAPRHRQSHVILGAVYQQQGRPQKALFHWEQAAQIAPPEPQLAQLIESTQNQMSLAVEK